ncbi:hypothetical protein PISMIDRAFT_43836, partial [Pisolithus microcarpus 441]
QYDCVCIKYSYGQIHKVCPTAWQQHLASAGSEEERHRIHAARLLGEQVTSLPPLAEHAFPPDCRSRRIDPTEANGNCDHPDDFVPFFPPPPLPHSPLSDETEIPPPPPSDETDVPPPPPPPNRMGLAVPEIIYQRRPRPQIDIQDISSHIILPKLQDTMHFITALASATLDDPVTKLTRTALDRLRNPPRQSLQIDNPGHRHSILTYLTTEHSSRDAYQKICRSTARNFPG